MSHHELPADWHERSLADPLLARAVLDHATSTADRGRKGVSVLFCGPEGRLRQPVHLEGMPADPDLAERRLVLRWAVVCSRPAPEAPDQRPGTLLLALVRPEGRVGEDDRAWQQLALEICTAAGIELLGVHVVTLAGVETLPRHLA